MPDSTFTIPQEISGNIIVGFEVSADIAEIGDLGTMACGLDADRISPLGNIRAINHFSFLGEEEGRGSQI